MYRLKYRISTIITLCGLLFILNDNCHAQKDSTQNSLLIPQDMETKRKIRKEARRKKFLATLPANHNPKTASLLGLIPGGGQIYNRRFWKLPIVYAGFGTLGYFTVSSYIDYGKYRKYYLRIVDTTPNTYCDCPELLGLDSTEYYVKINRDNARSNSEIFVLSLTLFWGLTIIDAFVDAHLMHFDISDDLSMSVRPKVDYDFSARTFVPSVGLSFKPKPDKKLSFPVDF
jgi:hypothetical protein